MTLLTWPCPPDTELSANPQPQCPYLCIPTIASISPHTTLCLYKPLLVGEVRNPSLPHCNSRQSRAISARMAPAATVCAGARPNVIHFPMRCFMSVSQRGERVAVAGWVGEGVVDCWRWPITDAAIGRREWRRAPFVGTSARCVISVLDYIHPYLLQIVYSQQTIEYIEIEQ